MTKQIQRVLGDGIAYMRSLPDNSVQCIITDPMYDSELYVPDLLRVCSGNIIVFCSPENPFFKPDEIAYWIKATSTKNYSKHLGRFVELIHVLRRGDTFNAGLHWSNYTGVYTDLIMEKSVHPYQKPLSLIQRLVAIYSKPGDTILDPFMGSGVTLRAAKMLGRRAVGVEIEPKYFDLSADLESA